MRTVLRLCLVGMLVASVGLAGVSVAEAKHKGQVAHHKDKKQNKKIRKARREAKQAHERIQQLKEWNFGLAEKNNAQDAQFNTLKSLVDGAVPIITKALTDLESGLLALQSALEDDVAPALEAIDDALNDETTGLVGLNLARPQFGAYEEDGTFIGSTGDAGGFGPDDSDAIQGPTTGGAGDASGVFVVDFRNDVSARVYSVNVFPLGPAGLGGGAVDTASAVNCSASDDVGDLCGYVQNPGAPARDSDPNKVVVQYGDGSSGGPANGFSVTAFSG